jgi:hypothetical protein
MELFDRNSFELDPETRTLMEAAIEGLSKGKDSSVSPDVILGRVSNINELELYDGRYKYTFEVHNELPHKNEAPNLYGKKNEKPLKPYYDIDLSALQTHLMDPDELLPIPNDPYIDYKKNFFPNLNDLLPAIVRFHTPLEEVDPLTSPEYWRVAVALGVVIGKQVTTPVHDQLHAEIYETAE